MKKKLDFLDIGCRYGITTIIAHWNKTRPIEAYKKIFNFYGIDGDPEALIPLKQKNDYFRLIAKAISDKKSQRDLYITKMNGCSSILKPDYEAIKKNLSNPKEFIDWFEIEKIIKVDTDTIENICKSNKINPSVIKIDIQGAEYEALLGAEAILDSCSLLLIETSLKKTYINQKTIEEILQFLISKNFDVLYSTWKPHLSSEVDMAFIKSPNLWKENDLIASLFACSLFRLDTAKKYILRSIAPNILSQKDIKQLSIRIFRSELIAEFIIIKQLIKKILVKVKIKYKKFFPSLN